jgi:Spy/CpxP family protein refolding chaperone
MHVPGMPYGVSVSIDNGKVTVKGIDAFVKQQMQAARAAVKNDKNIPAASRDKIIARMDRVNAIVERRLAKLNNGADMSKLEAEMEAMGEEIEQAMEGLEDELEEVGVAVGADFAKQFGNFDFDFDFDHDDDDLNAIPMAPDLDSDDDDMRDAIGDLRDLALDANQKDQIGKLRVESDRSVAAAKAKLDSLSDKLEAALENAASADADIARMVDQISAQEAEVRKARILAWHKARRVLDAAQRKKVQDAAAKAAKAPKKKGP